MKVLQGWFKCHFCKKRFCIEHGITISSSLIEPENPLSEWDYPFISCMSCLLQHFEDVLDYKGLRKYYSVFREPIDNLDNMNLTFSSADTIESVVEIEGAFFTVLTIKKDLEVLKDVKVRMERMIKEKKTNSQQIPEKEILKLIEKTNVER